MYKAVIRPLFFLFDPEKIHHFTFALIRFVCKIPGVSLLIKKLYLVEDKRLEKNLFGLTFKNPIGLAAGFDKDAKLYNELSNFGFGFIEIGTLTPKPQDGGRFRRGVGEGARRAHTFLNQASASRRTVRGGFRR